MDKLMNELYFGTIKKPKNPFSKCKSANEVFNLNRKILIEKKNLLDRLCMVVNYDGSLRVKGGVPDVGLMKKFCNKFYMPGT